MRYASTIVYVADVQAAVDFYTQAFDLEVGFMPPGGGYATLAGDGGQLAFATHDVVAESIGDEARRAPAGFEVWIETTDVPGAVERATAAGAEVLHEPVRKPWGQEIAYVRAPDGTLIELGEPVAEG
jgi:catechol 2,3-dioxygenase-like lactoylglutathione lyase family enzyme